MKKLNKPYFLKLLVYRILTLSLISSSVYATLDDKEIKESKSIRILVAEDATQEQKIISKIFEKINKENQYKINFKMTFSANEAYEVLETESSDYYHILVTDFNMDSKSNDYLTNGGQLIDYIKLMNPNTHVIAISSKLENQDRMKKYMNDTDIFLHKPLDIQTFIDVIKNYF